jgi:hypothetical protein
MHDDQKARLLQESRVDREQAMATQLLLILQIALSRMKWLDATAMESIAPLEKPEAKQARKRAAFAAQKIYADAVCESTFGGKG